MSPLELLEALAARGELRLLVSERRHSVPWFRAELVDACRRRCSTFGPVLVDVLDELEQLTRSGVPLRWPPPEQKADGATS